MSDQGRVNRQAFLDTLTDLGVPEQTARGALGSIAWESGKNLDSGATAEGDGADGSDSIGWGQWNSTRAVQLKSTAAAMGLPWQDPRVQREHLKNELLGPYRGVLDDLRSQDSMMHGADVWTRQYEVPKVKNVNERYNRAVELANLDGVTPSAPQPVGGPVTGFGDGTPGSMDVPAKSVKTYDDIWTPPPDATPDEQRAHRESTASFPDVLKAAYSADSLTSTIMRAGSLSSFEASAEPYKMSQEEWDQRTKGLAPEYHDWLTHAISPEHADAIQSAAETQQSKVQQVEAAGWRGTAARGLATFLDPTAIAIGVGTGALGNVATKTYQLGTASRVAVNAALGAGSNTALDYSLNHNGDPEHHDLAMSALTGAALGATYGLLSGAHGSEGFGRAARKGIRDTIGDADPTKPAIEDPNGPSPERPEPIRPADPAQPRRTGDPTVDDAIKRNDEWDAIDRADEVFRRRLARRGDNRPAEPIIEPPDPTDIPKPKDIPTPPERPQLGPNDVETNVLNESSLSRKSAQYVEALAAKLNLTSLLRVGDIRKWSGWRDGMFGVAIPMGDGSVRILVDHSLPQAMIVETLSHEFGHAYDMVKHGMRLYRGSFNAEGGATQELASLNRAWGRWKAKVPGQTLGEFHKTYYAPGQVAKISGESFGLDRPVTEAYPGSHLKYTMSHQEWLAQEWAKGLAHLQDNHTVVGKLYKGAVDVWRRMYYAATGNLPENVPSEAFQNWLKGIYDENAKPAQRLGKAASEALASTSGELPPEAGEPIITRGRPQLSAASGLGGLEQSGVARTALGGVRFSIAGVLGRSNNPAVRALGGVLVEDSVGKQGGAVTPHSAELYARQKSSASTVRIAQARKVALDAWKEEKGLNYFAAKSRESEFEATIAEALRLPNNSPEFKAMPKWAQQAASHYNSVADEVRQHQNSPFLTEGLEGRPVDGFGSVEGDERYLMRVWSAAKVAATVDQKSYAHVEQLITKAIASAQPHLIDTPLLDKLGRGMTREIYKRAQGVVDDNVARMFAVDNLESVKWDLVNRYGLGEDEASQVIERLRKGRDSSADPRAKRRILMDEFAEHDGTKLSDLLVNNATALTNAYARHGWAKVALARVRIPDAVNPGELLVDGITNDGDWNALINAVRARGHDEGVPRTTTDREVQALQVAYDQIKGVPHPQQQERWAQAVRALGKLNLMRLGNQFTFAQLGESYNMLSEISLGALAQQVPSFRRIITADGRWVKANALDRWVENVFGLGAEGVRLIADHTHADDLHSLPLEASGFWDHANEKLTTASDAVLHLSGFHFVDGMMKQWTAKAIAQEFFDMAHRFPELPGGGFDTTKANYRRMAQLGLSDEMLQRVLRGVKDNAQSERGIFTNGKLTDPRLDSWRDQEARISFEQALMRKARQVIQENDIGSMHQWMPHPIWRMIMQFRAFPLHAYDKQLMMGLAMHDSQSTAALALGAAIPTLIYAVQQHIAALGRSDSGAWIDKRLDAPHLIGAAIQRHGWSSMLPTAVDSALPFFGQKPFFDARNTGQQSDLLFGNPTTSLITDTSKAIGGTVKSFTENRRLSQDELRDWHRLFSNNLVTGAILNSMITDRPVHPPKSPRW